MRVSWTRYNGLGTSVMRWPLAVRMWCYTSIMIVVYPACQTTQTVIGGRAKDPQLLVLTIWMKATEGADWGLQWLCLYKVCPNLFSELNIRLMMDYSGCKHIVLLSMKIRSRDFRAPIRDLLTMATPIHTYSCMCFEFVAYSLLGAWHNDSRQAKHRKLLAAFSRTEVNLISIKCTGHADYMWRATNSWEARLNHDQQKFAALLYSDCRWYSCTLILAWD